MVVQELGSHASLARGMGWIPGWGTKILQKKKKKEREKESENSINDIHYVITAKGGYNIYIIQLDLQKVFDKIQHQVMVF